MNSLNDRIKLIFKNSELTQTEISKRLKISQSAVSNLIAGKKNPSERTISDIAERFDVNLEWLKTGKGPIKQEHPLKKELAEFFTKIMATDVPYRDEFIYGLSFLEPDDWDKAGKFILRLAGKIEENETGN